jgi:ubiquinone biosynthesis monooxygenase Coq7
MNEKIIKYLRSDHAGELGAVHIYIGILKTTKCPEIKSFSKEHLITEQKHLNKIEQILPERYYSKFLNIWKISGFLLGSICGLLGPKWVYYSIETVESFVEKHYQDQIDYLTKLGSHSDLLSILMECQADEISHKLEAAEKMPPAKKGLLLTYWLWLVDWGSKQAVKIAKTI